MEDNKNDFKSKALSHIPQELISSMLNEVKVETAGMGILDALAKNTPKTSPLPIMPKVETVPIEKPSKIIVVDGVAIKVSLDPYEGAMTLFAFLLSTVWAKDKKVAKVLKAFNFSFSDCNGEVLYPKKKGKKK